MCLWLYVCIYTYICTHKWLCVLLNSFTLMNLFKEDSPLVFFRLPVEMLLSSPGIWRCMETVHCAHYSLGRLATLAAFRLHCQVYQHLEGFTLFPLGPQCSPVPCALFYHLHKRFPQSSSFLMEISMLGFLRLASFSQAPSLQILKSSLSFPPTSLTIAIQPPESILSLTSVQTLF